MMALNLTMRHGADPFAKAAQVADNHTRPRPADG